MSRKCEETIDVIHVKEDTRLIMDIAATDRVIASENVQCQGTENRVKSRQNVGSLKI